MGRVFIVELEGQVYSCRHCKTHLTKDRDIISKSFTCRYGLAYFFNEVVNISIGAKEDRMMITGLYTVHDIFCVGCGSNVGWKYVTAHDVNQKYKEGKSVLELYKIMGPHESNDLVTAHDVNQKYKEGKSVLELYKIMGPHESNDLVCQEVSRLVI